MKILQFTEIQPQIQVMDRYRCSQPEIKNNKYSLTPRILYVERRGCLFHTQKETLPLRQGTFLYLPPGILYGTELEAGLSVINIHFTFLPSERVFFKNAMIFNNTAAPAIGDEDQVRFADVPLFSEMFHTGFLPEGESIINTLMEEHMKRRLEYRFREQLLLTDLLLLLYRQSFHTDFPKHPSVVDDILNYIVEHCETRLTREGIGEFFHYHPASINRLVQSATGMTLHQYIEDTRMQRAMVLLASEDIRITEIAHRLCYYDSSHFSTVFQKHTGMTPTEYRKSRMS